MARGAGRGEAARRPPQEEEEQRGRRFPPPAEVAYEILAGAGRALSLAEIAAQGAERLLMPDAFVRDGASLRAALLEDNRRRESAGSARRSSSWTAMPSCSSRSPSRASAPPPSRRRRVPQPPPQSVSELRRAALAALRRRLRECDAATIEHLAARLLEKTGFRELKVAKRGREHVIYTGAPEDGPGRPAPRHPDGAERRGRLAPRRDRAPAQSRPLRCADRRRGHRRRGGARGARRGGRGRSAPDRAPLRRGARGGVRGRGSRHRAGGDPRGGRGVLPFRRRAGREGGGGAARSARGARAARAPGTRGT